VCNKINLLGFVDKQEVTGVFHNLRPKILIAFDPSDYAIGFGCGNDFLNNIMNAFVHAVFI
jgi:hypothetical protein